MRAFESSSLLADPAPIWLADAPTLADDDPMAQVLPWLVRHLGMTEALAAATGMDDDACRDRPGQLLQSLQQLGFDTRLSHEEVTRLSAADLPAVLRLRTGDACVLTALQGAPGGLRRCHVVVLTPEPMAFTVTDTDLARECTGQSLLIRRPPSRGRAAEPAAEPPSALARALADRRAAMAAQAAQRTPQTHPMHAAFQTPPAHPTPPTLDVSLDFPAPAAPVATPVVRPPVASTAPVAAMATAATVATVAATAPLPPETRPGFEMPEVPEVPAVIAQRSAPPVLPTLDEVIDPEELASLVARATSPGLARWMQPQATASARDTRPFSTDAAGPVSTVHTAAAAPPVPDLSLDAEMPPALAASPLAASPPPNLSAPPPLDNGPDVVLDLGFLDRQTGAGRLRGRVAQWQQQVRSSLGQLARAWPPRRPVQAADRPAGAPSRRHAASPALPVAALTGALPGALAGTSTAAPPGRAGGWRPRFGLGWPLGPTPVGAAAANASAPTVRREPTLNPLSQALQPDLGLMSAEPRWPGPMPAPAASPPRAAPSRAAPLRAELPRAAPLRAESPRLTPAHATVADDFAAMLPSASARYFADPEPRRPMPAEPAAAGPKRPPGLRALRSAGLLGASLLARCTGPWQALTSVRLRWPDPLAAPRALRQRLDVLATRHRDKLSARLRLVRPDALARRWRLAQRLDKALQLPLLAACGAVCLLDGLPLAWARMVSVSSLKAAAWMLPGLMKQALAADQDRAAAVLAGTAAAPAPAGRGAAARGAAARGAPVPTAANAPRLAATGSPGIAGTAGTAPALLGPSTLAMVAARAEKAERARARGIDVATTLRRRSEVLAMGPPVPAARPRRAPPGAGLLAA